METLAIIIQIVIALGVFNVWLVRFGKPTSWRGGEAESLPGEFEAYGLPGWSVYLVGALKISLAVLLLVGIWVPAVVLPAGIGMAVLMLGAVLMHLKINDPLSKALPAFSLIVLSLFVAFV